MITKISKLDKIGKFSSINQEKNFQCGEYGQNRNIIFGFNGSGKTTISNAISFFANDSFISENEKKEIYDDVKNNNNSYVELSLQDSVSIKYPANNTHNKSIYVFNPNFVATHVFNGTKGNLKKFSNIGGEIKNKEIDIINEQIKILNEEKTKLDDENKKLDEKHKEITRNKSKNFGKALTDRNKTIQVQSLLSSSLSTETIEALEKKLEQLSVDYDLSKKQTELQSDLEVLRQVDFSRKAELDFNVIDDFLSKNIQQLSKDVLEKKIKEIQNLFEDNLYKQSTEKWLRYGKEVLKNIGLKQKKICPVCNTDITDKFKNLLDDYEGYFDDTYEKFIKNLNEKIENLSMIIDLVEQYELSADKLESVHIKYKKLLTDFSFDKYDFTNVKDRLKKLKQNLKSKNDNVQKNITKPQDIESNIILLNSALINFQKLKDSMLIFLESKKLNTNTIEDKIRRTYKKIILLEFDQTIQIGALKKYRDGNDRIIAIRNAEIPKLRGKLSEELKKIKIESKSISNYLVKMGIDHFDVDINEDKEDENIVIRFKNSSNAKNKLKNCLSEGEKTALAFAYFLSKFENEVNAVEKIKESIVVIDDPISSLDENRLYSTAYLIHKNFENVRQLIVMSHNFLFLKHFNSLSKKPNCLFLNQNKLSELPEELKNFETPYFYMLRNLFDFNNDGVDYNEVKKYLPNYIRRILETFLSFKFSKISSENSKYRSPGLMEFNNSIEQTNLEDNLKIDLKEKITIINKICDAHSHGNAHHTQENFYISKDDLKILAKNAIYIIEEMDNLHKTAFLNQEKVEQLIR